jgi:hypothetical protein
MEDYKLRDLRASQAHTGLVVELEDLKIKTRLTNEKFASVDAIGAPSKLRTIRKAAALARTRPTLLFSPERKAARRK